ncbi:unnamed protein product [Calypogeia fissa]
MENGGELRPNQQKEQRQQQEDRQLVPLKNSISKTSIISNSATSADTHLSHFNSSKGPQISGILHSLISQAHACRYEFAEYFVAWQGVLTVAFAGIPPSVIKLKKGINSQLAGCLVTENPGSKWPKISLGCLRDGMTLTLDQLRTLRQICSEEMQFLSAIEPVVVDNLSVVLYANCCLEKTITVATTPLAFPVDISRPIAEETSLVQDVLNEFAMENVKGYHSFTSKAGNRSAHYRNFRAGATLVHFLKAVPTVLDRFRARVDSELPGMYDWFRDDSLHITVRALF